MRLEDLSLLDHRRHHRGETKVQIYLNPVGSHIKDLIFESPGSTSKVDSHTCYVRRQIYDVGERTIAERVDVPGMGAGLDARQQQFCRVEERI